MEYRAVHLLSRRYDLTATGYKYLEIGINVDPPWSSPWEIITDTVAVSRIVEGSLRTAMEYLQDATIRI